jgi:photosystem II stability/assembly factor-like uncharacterized protein
VPITVPGVSAILQQFVPSSATTWWAVVESNATGQDYVVRTADSGVRWHQVRPPTTGGTYDFLSSDVAWAELGAGDTLWRTLDGGGSWGSVGTVPRVCGQLDFVDEAHGWCIDIAAAAGSTWVTIYRTTDGGSTWALVSRTGAPGFPSTPGSLPSGCDKAVSFTSPTVGWASSWCNGGSAVLYTTEDAGATWYPLSTVPLPPGTATPAGEGLGTPAVAWPDLASALSIGELAGTVTGIATSQDGGTTWHAQLVPGAQKYWSVDLIDPAHWRLTDGNVLMATDDAGRHWRTWKPAVSMKDSLGTPLTLQFLSATVGWAVPGSSGGPFWWTTDGGTTWTPVRIAAGPLVLPAT